MKKLKSIDFKALFVNHGEKMGLGLIVLIVLVALSSTSWSRYEKSPDELKTKISEANNRITSPSNIWPQAKSEQYVVVDYSGKARDVFTGLNTAKYEFTTPLFWPLYRKKEKAREPELSVPQLLIAEEGLAVLLMRPAQAEMTGGEFAGTEGGTRSTENANSDIRPVEGSNIRPVLGAPPAGQTPMTTGSGGLGINPTTARGRGPAHETAGPPPGMYPPGMMPQGSTGMGTGGGTARGVRFIAVRAVVPIKEQIERAMRALNMNYADASAAIEYTDFVLQRQTAVPGPNPWSGEWETLDPARSLEVISESEWDDADPVPSDLQDVAITSPLPRRLLRYWGDAATHPSIKHFRLSDAERDRENKLVQQLMEEAERLNLTNVQVGRKRGFADVSNDVRGLTKTMMAGSEGNNVMQMMARQMNESGGNGPRMGVPDIQNRLTASGRLYLFRYIDFDVQPGMAYRYQVRLQLRNPNFKRAYEEVENPDITKEEYIMTGWSNISNPAVVPNTVNYFLKEIERDPVREERSKRPVASIAMFEWDAKIGTMWADTLKILSVGQFISEKKKSLVLDPAIPSFEEKEVPFTTEDVLVDAAGDVELSPELHPDLQLKPERGRKDARAGALPEALVATSTGALRELDPVSTAQREQELKARVDEERRSYEFLLNAPKETTSALDGAYPGMEMSSGMPSPGMPGMPRTNPRRRGGGGSAAGPGGGHGAGGPGGGHGSSSESGTRGGRNTRPRSGAGGP